MKRNTKKFSSNESVFQKRRNNILQKIKGEAALFTSSEESTLSRDQHYNFRQNSDLTYLTGFDEPESALLLLGNNKGPRSILFVKEKDELKSRWGKGPIGLSSAKRKFNIDEIRPWENLAKDIKELLNFTQILHYAFSSHSQVDKIVIDLISTTCGPSIDRPSSISDSRLITSLMRIKKEKQEIADIRHACEISAKSFVNFTKKIKTLKSEAHAARVLESEFSALGAHGLAFNTIVASGKNATVLHHNPTFQPLWKSSLVLIDAGASFNNYCSDISRTIPVSGKFTIEQAQVYDIVLNAYYAALQKAIPGQSMEDIHKAAVNEITKGLVEIKILKGKIQDLVNEKKYFNYYMHRTGHWLGLDVHDIAPVIHDGKLIHSYKRPLEPGNVITIEPGLYFENENKNIPQQYRGIGIRIEDTVLITASGNTILTAPMPKERKDIENLMETYV